MDNELLENAIKKLTEDTVVLYLAAKEKKEKSDQLKTGDNDAAIDAVFKDLTVRLKIQTLITLATLDLLVVLKLFKLSSTTWEKSFLLAKGYLTIHEFVVSYEQPDISRALKEITENDQDHTELLKEIVVAIRNFKKEHNEKTIGEIRNKVAGHYHENLDDYFTTLWNMDPSKSIKAIMGWISIMQRFDQFLFALKDSINTKLKTQEVAMKEAIENDLAMLKMKLNEYQNQLKLEDPES